MHRFMPILENALGREMVLPERRIRTVEKLLEIFSDVGDIVLPIQNSGEPPSHTD